MKVGLVGLVCEALSSQQLLKFICRLEEVICGFREVIWGGYLWVQGGYLRVQGGYLWLSIRFGRLYEPVSKSGRWVGQMGR